MKYIVCGDYVKYLDFLLTEDRDSIYFTEISQYTGEGVVVLATDYFTAAVYTSDLFHHVHKVNGQIELADGRVVRKRRTRRTLAKESIR